MMLVCNFKIYNFLCVLCVAEEMIPGDMEQATGLERKELEALMQGKEVILISAHQHRTAAICTLHLYKYSRR